MTTESIRFQAAIASACHGGRPIRARVNHWRILAELCSELANMIAAGLLLIAGLPS